MNLSFNYMCKHNLDKEMSQLIWMPATSPLYKVENGSIFKKHEKYSKLLVFGEYKYLQRGGALLLSEYCKKKNDINIKIPGLHYSSNIDDYIDIIEDPYSSELYNMNLRDIIGHDELDMKKMSDEKEQYEMCMSQLNSYRSSFGAMASREQMKKLLEFTLENKYKIEDIIIDLQDCKDMV